MNVIDEFRDIARSTRELRGSKAATAFLLGWLTICFALPMLGTVWSDLASSTFWVDQITQVMTLILVLGMAGFGGALVLVPFTQFRVVRLLQTVLVLPMALAISVARYYQFGFGVLVSFILVVLLPLGIARILRDAGIIPYVSDNGLNYTILVFASVVAVRLSDKLVAGVMRLFSFASRGLVNADSLLTLVRPAAIRRYLYGVTLLAYIVANLEGFENATLVTATWWVAYKAVLVEVLLTYVAIDAVFIAWQDSRQQPS